MMSRWQDWPPQVLAALREGVVIPAHPLALNRDRKVDARRQRALTRYYLDAGARGLAVGVHTTQFAIREAGAAPVPAPPVIFSMRPGGGSGWPCTPPSPPSAKRDCSSRCSTSPCAP